MKKLYSIIAVAVIATGFNAQNLLQNPDFENGFEHWKAGTSTSYTAPTEVANGGKDGSKYVEYNNPTKTTGFYQNVAVTGGKTYVISFWYKSSDENKTRIWSVYKGSDGKPTYTTSNVSSDSFRNNDKYLPAVAEWTQHTAEMPANANAVSLDVAVRAYRMAVSSFDSFNVYEKGSLSVMDSNVFEQSIKLNTIVQDKLTIFTPERVTVNVYSLEGRLVSSNRVSDGGSIDFSTVAKGNYIVTIDNGKTKISKKIIKK